MPKNAESVAILRQAAAPIGLNAFFGAWLTQSRLGWTVGERDGNLMVAHPDDGTGQNISCPLAPDDNLGVTILANWDTVHKAIRYFP